MRPCLLVMPLMAAACGTISDADLDAEAVAAGADGKADSSVVVTRLERSTPAEVSATFLAHMGPKLVACFDGYKAKFDTAATQVTQAATQKFSLVDACGYEWWDLGQLSIAILQMKGVTGLTPAEIVAEIPTWAEPKLEAVSVDGFVMEKNLDLIFYDDLWATRNANAMAREKDPSGVDLATIRAQWKKVRDDTTLDRAYFNPVMFSAGALDGADVFKNLRAAFPLRRLSLVSTGYNAIKDFAEASEGPEGDAEFAPIATALRKYSIKKRFYFSGGSDSPFPWSSNVLVVVDQHGQAWGMQMGYSE
jgi:hypothetical protein